MKHTRFGFSSVAAGLILALCLAISGTARAGGDETLHFRLFQAPKFSGSNEVGPLHRTLIVLEGASAEEWSEAIEILKTKRKGAYKNPLEISSALRAMRRESCGVVRDSVLSSDDSSVFWSMESDSCPLAGPQFSMTRVLCGKKVTWILIYTSTAPNVAPVRREEVAAALAGASVLKP